MFIIYLTFGLWLLHFYEESIGVKRSIESGDQDGKAASGQFVISHPFSQEDRIIIEEKMVI
jgi:hypothetical protein